MRATSYRAATSSKRPASSRGMARLLAIRTTGKMALRTFKKA